MKTADIRQQFLSFFAARGHQVVPSASLVPANDPTLLFTNSGMVQFKDVFTGRESRGYARATTAQRCVRAGGKHNDLENVGYTARHHTFFEMLGNFSFGDYFKRDAIRYAWQLLTGVYRLPAEKLWVTVYVEDDEAYDIWANEVGVPPERIIRIGDNKGARYASDNFWQMADTGPCGPCSEVFYDHGPEVWGGPPGSPEEDGDRYIEIWNLVFMQFERDAAGTLTPLPRPCVDTGMGLERMAAVLQHVHSNYEIDLFRQLIAAAARETGCTDAGNNSLKVIADHIRACAFLVVDGVIPGNEGRGYVLRRIIRRALRHGHKLGQTEPFFYRLVPDLVAEMGAAYPELASQQARIAQLLRQEEERFGETLEHGLKVLEAALAELPEQGVLHGQTAFTLYDTYGFPLDLTQDICRERGVAVDEAGFDAAMQAQKAQARAAGKFKMAQALDYTGAATVFTGYDSATESATVLALFVEGASVQTLAPGQTGVVVLDKTPFYAESGGQVGDTGEIGCGDAVFAVADTRKIRPDVWGHEGALAGDTALRVGDAVTAAIHASPRRDTARHHSATHLLHQALRDVLGSHVQQRGSHVDCHATRFDFSHTGAVTADELREIERRVNVEILANTPIQTRLMDIEAAKQTGAMMLFDEKYGDTVRVLTIGTSTELCGGTHVARTGDIGAFKILSEGGVAAGIRRISACAGERTLAWLQQTETTLRVAGELLKTHPAAVVENLQKLLAHNRELERALAQTQQKLHAAAGNDLAAQAQPLGARGAAGTAKLLAVQVANADARALRGMVDQLKTALQSAVVVLAGVADDKISLAAGVTADLTARVKAGELVGAIAAQLGGKGGGRPDMAMGAGQDLAALPAALAAVRGWVEERL